MIFDFYEELFHGENFRVDVQRSDGDEEGRVIKTDEFAQHRATQIRLKREKMNERCIRNAFYVRFTLTLVKRKSTKSVANEENLAD